MTPSLEQLVAVLIYAYVIISPSNSFNIDVRSARIYSPPTGSGASFGYTVAQLVSHDKKWILVGAPKAQTRQPNVYRGGAVYKCPTDASDDCSQIEFDKFGNNIRAVTFQQDDHKSNQSFGATLYSSGINGFVVACAPHYVTIRSDPHKEDYNYDPVGNCFLADPTLTSFSEYSPCRDLRMRGPIHLTRNCLAGFTAAISSDKQRLFVGAVNTFYGQGQVWSHGVKQLMNDEEEEEEETDEQPVGDEETNEQPIGEAETEEGPIEMDNTYMSYSMATGDFTRDGIDDIVVGAPRGANLTGNVTLLSSELQFIQSLTGEAGDCGRDFCIGEYFGYSLAVADFNGDGLQDIAVGAPFFSQWPFDAYESGRVYVFYQKRSGLPFDNNAKQLLYGNINVGSRFGLSLAKLGDINRDGFVDLAVGAPYEDDAGVVYIYLGTSGGLLATPAQVVRAAALPNQRRPVGAFGFSLSGGLDLDGNQHADLVVGAYKTDMAVYFRSRPVIKMLQPAKLIASPQHVNIDDLSCMLANQLHSCFVLKLCLSFDGVKVPQMIDMSFKWSVDVRQMYAQRAAFANGLVSIATNVTLTKRKSHCLEQVVYLKPEIRDKLSAIVSVVTYELTTAPLSHPTATELPPILDYFIPHMVTTQVNIKKKCGLDDICIPNLNITAKSLSSKHVPTAKGAATAPPIEVKVMVDNHGEDAFEAQVLIGLPPGVSYVTTQQLDGETTVSCDITVKELIVCDIGNPLPGGHLVGFLLKLLPNRQAADASELVIFFHTKSANDEFLPDLANNNVTVTIPVYIISEISLSGVSKPNALLINTTTVEDGGTASNSTELVHVYELHNQGPSSISRVRVNVSWPTHLYNGQSLVNLTTPPLVTKGNGTCRLIDSGHVTASSISLDAIVNLTAVETIKPGFGLRMSCAANEHARWHTCSTLQCDVNLPLDDDYAVIQVHSTLHLPSLVHLLQVFHAVVIASSASAEVTDVPYRIKLAYPVSDYKQVETYIEEEEAARGFQLPQLWILLCAITLGFILLFIIVIILCKIGFFNRRVAEDMQRLHMGKRMSQQYSGEADIFDVGPDVEDDDDDDDDENY